MEQDPRQQAPRSSSLQNGPGVVISVPFFGLPVLGSLSHDSLEARGLSVLKAGDSLPNPSLVLWGA